MWNNTRFILRKLEGWFTWLSPLTLLILSLVFPVYLFQLDFLKFLEIIVWPMTALTILFFFKKVFTYLFFSIDEFNFFGLKGHLKNVNEVILEEANRKFVERKKDEKRKADMVKHNLEMANKEEEINKAQGSAEENLNLAKKIMDNWRESSSTDAKTIADLEKENRRLSEIIDSILETPSSIDEDSPEIFPEKIKKTSDPILEEESETTN